MGTGPSGKPGENVLWRVEEGYRVAEGLALILHPLTEEKIVKEMALQRAHATSCLVQVCDVHQMKLNKIIGFDLLLLDREWTIIWSQTRTRFSQHKVLRARDSRRPFTTSLPKNLTVAEIS